MNAPCATELHGFQQRAKRHEVAGPGNRRVAGVRASLGEARETAAQRMYYSRDNTGRSGFAVTAVRGGSGSFTMRV